MITLGCGHYYHTTCIATYIEIQISSVCNITIKCPQFCDGCPEIMTRNVIDYVATKIENKDEILKKYDQYLINDFIQRSSNMRHCPGKGCGYVCYSNSRPTRIDCKKCGSVFCFKCGLECHVPASCENMQAWCDKCTDESENVNWILAHTAQCALRTRIGVLGPHAHGLRHRESSHRFQEQMYLAHNRCFL